MKRNNTLHLAIGLTALLVFLGTGAYMLKNFPALYGSNEVIRYQFRANHIYILMSALVNLMAALNTKRTHSGWRAVISAGSAALLLLAPVLFTIAFFLEPIHGTDARPLTFYGVLTLIVGTLFAYLPYIPIRRERKKVTRRSTR